jgi:crotonobetainyl-CoA:carnitine CoA-transferase CaiB-like acyl-CoA transferase
VSDTVDGALHGLRVVDLSRVLAGPYCGQVLADHGAQVLKIESPQGDETRTWGPPFEDGVASYYLGLNRNKAGMRLDLTTDEGRQQLLLLLQGADVLIENFKIGTFERWGLGQERLEREFPRLVHCRVTGYGADGPLGGLPGYDAAIQALTGVMSVNGDAKSGPLRVGVPVVDLVTGLNAAIGILMALQERERSGRGQFVEIALFDCGLSLLHPHAANLFGGGTLPARTGNAHPNIYPYDTFQTRTSQVFIAVGNDRQFRKLCVALRQPTLADCPEFGSSRGRSVNRESLRTRLQPLFACVDGDAIVQDLSAAGVPCAPILSVQQAFALPHTQHRRMTVALGKYRGVASPIKLNRTPATYRTAPP